MTNTPHSALYSVVQFMPDPGRREAINVGLVVWCRKCPRLQMRHTVHNNSRICTCFPQASDRVDGISAATVGLFSRLWEETRCDGFDFENFCGSQGNDIVMTPPRSMRIEDHDADFDLAFKQLVEPPTPERSVP